MRLSKQDLRSDLQNDWSRSLVLQRGRKVFGLVEIGLWYRGCRNMGGLGESVAGERKRGEDEVSAGKYHLFQFSP